MSLHIEKYIVLVSSVLYVTYYIAKYGLQELDIFCELISPQASDNCNSEQKCNYLRVFLSRL